MSLTLGHTGARREGLLLDADTAVRRIKSGSTVAVGGSGSLLQVPETLLAAIERRWESDAAPAGLTVVHVMGLGDHLGRGIDHIAIPGLVTRFIGSHFVLSPREQRAISANLIQAIALPAGTISLLYREIAARRPGLFTDIGLDTFVDPRQQWGRLNSITTDGLSELVNIGGQEWLFYPRFDIDVALIRASTADTSGNISMEDEAAFSDNLALAQAARNSGGLVIVEVKRVVDAGEIPGAQVRIPGALVDHVIIAEDPVQTPITIEDGRRTGSHRAGETPVEPLPLDQRKVVARRAAMEIREGDLANLGVGMANGISYVALEEGFLPSFTLTIEQGVYGGLSGVGLDSGTAIHPSAIIDMASQFDFYDGGGLDFAGLAFAQVDRAGNVNVTSVDGVPIGPGGFIDISQKARTVVFCGSFRGGGLYTDVAGGSLSIVREGRYAKFVDSVSHITFNAQNARRRGQEVLYVTERAVFRLADEGLDLIEIAPGVDLERDVLGQMGFVPQMPARPTLMDPRLFVPTPVGIAVRPPRTRLGSPARHKTDGMATI